ncbi:MAG: hypothetical protein ACTHJR_19560 [Sphingomonas sp.]|uniref:hypothetical protein n=1 Tax=Sphingomonas sp. TaxID=28214 RepID=UPI003F7EBE7E
MLHSLRGGVALLIAVIVAAPLSAQNRHGTTDDAPSAPSASIDSLQNALNAFLNAAQSVQLHNWRSGDAGKGKWDMVRRLSGAVTVRRCYTRLGAPTVLTNSGIAVGDIAKAYEIDWALIGAVSSNGSRVKFTAAHMTPDEYGELTLATPEEAQTVRDTFTLLRDRCRA